MRAAQLAACAVLLESNARDEKNAVATARALLSCSAFAPLGVVAIAWDINSWLRAVETGVFQRICGGIDPSNAL